MALRGYRLRSPSVVIDADSRDPHVSWQHHLDRTAGLRGGVDIVAAVGTPVLARATGVVRTRSANGSAGDQVYLWHEDNPGYHDVFSHLSAFAVADGTRVRSGDVVALSGDTGGVVAHLHWHLEDPQSVRLNPWDHFGRSGGMSRAGLLSTLEENDMSAFVFGAGRTITWPNGYSNSYPQNVYDALKAYVEDPDDPTLAWVADIFVPHAWAATDFLIARSAKVAAAAVRDELDLDSVLEGLQPPTPVTEDVELTPVQSDRLSNGRGLDFEIPPIPDEPID